MSTPRRRAPFELGVHEVPAGSRRDIDLRIVRMPSGSWMDMPVAVLHGRRSGPVVWLSGAIHGDEVIGVEIIRQVLRRISPRSLTGTILAVPVVNVPGFATGDRYLPDRRDLNRSFPGSRTGSLAARLADLFMSEIVGRSDLGIDLHSGSDHRSNLAQIRGDLDDPRTRELATVFGAPVMLHSRLRDGSLREAAVRSGKPVLLFEGGEAWRFDPAAIEVGTSGILRVLAHLDMIEPALDVGLEGQPVTVSRSSRWIRSPMSGLVRLHVELGTLVHARQEVATVATSLGTSSRLVRTRSAGIVIGRSEQPVVHRGDALVHIASIEESA